MLAESNPVFACTLVYMRAHARAVCTLAPAVIEGIPSLPNKNENGILVSATKQPRARWQSLRFMFWDLLGVTVTLCNFSRRTLKKMS